MTISDLLLANEFLKYLFQLRVLQTFNTFNAHKTRLNHLECCKEVYLSQSIQSIRTCRFQFM